MFGPHIAGWIDPSYYSPPEGDVATVDQLIAYEQGDLGPRETVELFARLIKTGQAWVLQGHYGRAASSFIEAGVITEGGEVSGWVEDHLVTSGYLTSTEGVQQILEQAYEAVILRALSTEDLPAPVEVQALVDEVAETCGVPSAEVGLISTLDIRIGAGHHKLTGNPAIGISPEALRRLNEEELRSCIAHELAHLAFGHETSTPETEHEADAFAHRHGYGDGLASALLKIKGSSPAAAHLNLAGTSTHPPLADRLTRLGWEGQA